MAGKGRRTASRQAELNRRRKQNVKGPSGIPANSPGRADPEELESDEVSVGVEDTEIEATEEAQSEGQMAGATSTAKASRPSPVARTPRGEFAGQGQGRLRGERPAAYLYVGSELRRISLLTGSIIAALIVLGILL